MPLSAPSLIYVVGLPLSYSGAFQAACCWVPGRFCRSPAQLNSTPPYPHRRGPPQHVLFLLFLSNTVYTWLIHWLHHGEQSRNLHRFLRLESKMQRKVLAEMVGSCSQLPGSCLFIACAAHFGSRIVFSKSFWLATRFSPGGLAWFQQTTQCPKEAVVILCRPVPSLGNWGEPADFRCCPLGC